jgi:hypothetical protein
VLAKAINSEPGSSLFHYQSLNSFKVNAEIERKFNMPQFKSLHYCGKVDDKLREKVSSIYNPNCPPNAADELLEDFEQIIHRDQVPN